MNLRFIVTLVDGYIPVVIGSKVIMREWKQNNPDTIENHNTNVYAWRYMYIVDE